MNHEMMIYQARQDFIDMHKELINGEFVELEKYDSITKDLKKIDDINFQLMLQFVEKTDNIDVGNMWGQISAYIEGVKKNKEWNERKLEKLSWNKGELQIIP